MLPQEQMSWRLECDSQTLCYVMHAMNLSLLLPADARNFQKYKRLLVTCSGLLLHICLNYVYNDLRHLKDFPFILIFPP